MNEANAVQEIAKVNLWLDLFNWDNVINILALLFLVFIIIGFVREVTSSKNDDSLLDIFRPLGSSKMRINGIWLASIVVMLFSAFKGVLTEGLYGLILAAFVTDRVFARKDAPKKIEEDVTK